jgi:hypothetical protein
MKIIGIVMIVLALAAAIVPQFTDCHSQGRQLVLENGKTVDMKCHWTAMAEIGMAIPLAAVGGLLFFSKRKESIRSLSLMGALLGLGVVLIPTTLIGVCASNTMICNMVMKPALMMAGIVASGLGLAGMVISTRTVEPTA